MTLSRGIWGIVGLVALGCFQVAQHNAVILKGYALGARTRALHQQETDVAWLDARVMALASPAHLDDVAHTRRLQLIARATLPMPPGVGRQAAMAAALARAQGIDDSHQVVRVAAALRASGVVDDDTQD